MSPEFAARLSPEDLGDIAASDILLGTVQAFEAAAIAREAEDLKEFFEERAGLLEFGAGLPRPEAEIEAARITGTLARNSGYLWASLRAALADYPVLLAQVLDRPGPVRAWKGDRGMRTAESFYPTLSAPDLHALRPRIDEWAARDCALFLWATPPALSEALDIVGAWGFIYTTFGFTWIKTTKAGEPKMGMGWHTRANAELCLLAKRGKPRIQARDVPQVIMARPREHSRKPDEQYARIERLYGGPYLELFARHRRDGWDVWGDEAPLRAGPLPELSSRSSTTVGRVARARPREIPVSNDHPPLHVEVDDPGELAAIIEAVEGLGRPRTPEISTPSRPPCPLQRGGSGQEGRGPGNKTDVATVSAAARHDDDPDLRPARPRPGATDHGGRQGHGDQCDGGGPGARWRDARVVLARRVRGPSARSWPSTTRATWWRPRAGSRSRAFAGGG